MTVYVPTNPPPTPAAVVATVATPASLELVNASGLDVTNHSSTGGGGAPPKKPSREDSPSTSSSLIVPSWSKLASFLATTCCLWLSEPLLSLVDTTFVSWSQQGSDQLVTQLAAMGLATTLMDTLVYTTYFLAIATTTQIAEQAAHRHYRQLQLSASRLLGFAILCGCLVTVCTWTFAGTWLRSLAGSDYDASAPDMVPLATAFVRIRALVAPLTVSGMVAHAFCLVTDHAGTVALAVLISALTNVLLDAILTPSHGMLGAACATAAATSLSALVMLKTVCWQMKVWRLQEVQDATEGQGDDDDDQKEHDEHQHHDHQDHCAASMVQLVRLEGATAGTMMTSSAPAASSSLDDCDEDFNDDRSLVDDNDTQQRSLTPQPPKPPLLQQLRAAWANHHAQGHHGSSSYNNSNNMSGNPTTKSHSKTTSSSNLTSNHNHSSASSSSSSSASSTSPNTTLYTYNKQPVPMVSLPDREALVQLLKLSLPLAFYMWAETASYASLTLAATGFGPVALAAQNILMQLFHVLCCVSESLAQAAQAYLPATLYPRYHPASFRHVLMRLCRVAAVVAVVGYHLSLSILGGTGRNGSGGWFGSGAGHGGGGHGGLRAGAIPVVVVDESEDGTSSTSLLEDALDPEVVRQLQLAAPYLAACLCLHPFNAVIEGTVIATRDFGNIVRTYAVTLLAFGLILRGPATRDLAGVWRALVAWQLLRMVNYGWWRRRSPSPSSSVAVAIPLSLHGPEHDGRDVGQATMGTVGVVGGSSRRLPKPDPSGARCPSTSE